MQERLRFLITLYRKGLYEKDEIPESVIDHDTGSFFSTDYYDKVTITPVKQGKMEDFLGMDPISSGENDVTAVQQYAVYSDQYSDEECKSIFSMDIGFPYLSMIHVYITSDVLAGLGAELCDQSYIELFEQDLMKITQSHNDANIKTCVFRMFSACDFLVIVRSIRPEDSFKVSTRIRRQLIAKETTLDSSLIVYKTYTILTIRGRDITCIENNNIGSEQSLFVIRGRYSNKYWNDGGENIINRPSTVRLLNGRYDFLLHLSCDEFQKILPRLMKVKKVECFENDVQKTAEDESSKELQYLMQLLDKDYLSYINERLLLADKQENNDVGSTYIDEVYLKDDYEMGSFLYGVLNERCNRIQDKIGYKNGEGIYGKYIQKCSKNTTTDISIQLLKVLVDLCRNVNSLSDTRIYVVSLLNQLELVVDAVDEWLDQADYESEDFLAKMERYMQDSVDALEKYANLIRSNNFQTIQAPRYDIISGCSIEKILIGYGRFLNVMMAFSISEIQMSSSAQYLPIVIPNPNSNSPSVEICFREYVVEATSSTEKGVASLIKKEEADQREKKYLMIVQGPVTGRLVHGWNIITILFHEMAHSIRYESRDERNKVLEKMIVDTVTDYIVKNMFDMLHETGMATNEIDIYTDIIKNSIVKVILQYMEPIFEDLKEYSFDIFWQRFEKKLKEFMEHMISSEYDIKNNFLNYFTITNEYIDQEMLFEIRDILNQLEKLMKESSEELVRDKNSIKESLENYREKCISNIQDKSIAPKTDTYAEGDSASDGDAHIDNVIRSLRESTSSVISLLKDYEPSNYKMKASKEKLLADIYQELNKNIQWKTFFSDTDQTHLTSQDKNRLRLLRKLGLDGGLEEGHADFDKILEKSIRSYIYYTEKLDSFYISQYKEETADIYMCAMCDLDLVSYLVLIADMFPRNEQGYHLRYTERIGHIVLVQWGIQEDGDNLVDWEKVYDKIVGEFIQVYGLMTGTNYPQLSKNRNELLSAFSNLISPGIPHEIIYDDLQCGVVKLIIQILRDYPRIEWRLKNKDYILKDYLKGKKKYQELYKTFTASKDYLIKEIQKICCANKQYLRNLLTKKQNMDPEYNMRFEDFIMNMFYYDKLSSAMEGGRE